MAHGRSLQTQLALRVAIVAGLFALVAGFGVYRWSHAQSLLESRQSLLALATAVEHTAAVGAYTDDPVLLQEVADGVAQTSLVAAVHIVTPRQSIHGLRAGPDNAEPPAGVELLERPLLSPFDRNERVGALRLVPDQARIEGAASRQANAVMLVLVTLTVLVALIVNLAVQRLVAGPIGQMAAELGRMEPGSAGRMSVPRGHAHDELGGLVACANQLLQSNQSALQTERRLRAEVEAMEAHYRRIFDTSSAGIFVLDENGRLLSANSTVHRMLGRMGATLEQAREGDFLQRVFANPARAWALVEEARRSRSSVTGDLELLSLDGNLQWVHCLFSVQAPSAERPKAPTVVEGVVYDVTERRRAELAARLAAAHDTLTGLLRRAACAATVAGWRPSADALFTETYTAIFLDLDGFKRVNDEYGHGAGDEVLLETAKRLLLCARGTTDLVSRNGGDEFVVVLRGLGPGDPGCCRVAEGIRQQLLRPVRLSSGVQVSVGVSIGLASFPCHGESFEAVLRMADAAMYCVKHNGKNSFAMAVPARALAREPGRPCTATVVA